MGAQPVPRGAPPALPRQASLGPEAFSVFAVWAIGWCRPAIEGLRAVLRAELPRSLRYAYGTAWRERAGVLGHTHARFFGLSGQVTLDVALYGTRGDPERSRTLMQRDNLAELCEVLRLVCETVNSENRAIQILLEDAANVAHSCWRSLRQLQDIYWEDLWRLEEWRRLEFASMYSLSM